MYMYYALSLSPKRSYWRLVQRAIFFVYVMLAMKSRNYRNCVTYMYTVDCRLCYLSHYMVIALLYMHVRLVSVHVLSGRRCTRH